MNKIPKPQDLPNKPLVEAIFELRWALQPQTPTGDAVDPGFQILLGRFYDKVSTEFPEIEHLPVVHIPEPMVPNVVRYRFRTSKDGWPLVQLGPGVLSVNDTEGYSWPTFRPMLRKSVEALFEAYPGKIAPLRFVQATLRYVNAIPLNSLGASDNLLTFLRSHLHTNISIDSRLFDDPSVVENPVGMQLRLNYPLKNPKGTGVISFSTGMRENVSSVIWENIVISKDEHVPKTVEDFDSWFEDAHTLTDRWFFALCQGELLTKFGGNNDA